MNEYWHRNASSTSRDRPAASDSSGRIAWTVVILAALVLPLSQCARPRLHFGGYAPAVSYPSPSVATIRRPAVPAPAPIEPAQVEPEPVSPTTSARPADETPAVTAVPERSGTSATYQPGGVYKCAQPDGSIKYSDAPCSPSAERIQLENRHQTSASTFSAPTILSAAYASPRNGRSFDVTSQLRSMCVGGACLVHCGNQLAGDPDFGQGKYCAISYQCGGGDARQQLHLREGETYRLACTSEAGAAGPR
jgi:hypothetical protein